MKRRREEQEQKVAKMKQATEKFAAASKDVKFAAEKLHGVMTALATAVAPITKEMQSGDFVLSEAEVLELKNKSGGERSKSDVARSELKQSLHALHDALAAPELASCLDTKANALKAEAKALDTRASVMELNLDKLLAIFEGHGKFAHFVSKMDNLVKQASDLGSTADAVVEDTVSGRLEMAESDVKSVVERFRASSKKTVAQAEALREELSQLKIKYGGDSTSTILRRIESIDRPLRDIEQSLTLREPVQKLKQLLTTVEDAATSVLHHFRERTFEASDEAMEKAKTCLDDSAFSTALQEARDAVGVPSKGKGKGRVKGSQSPLCALLSEFSTRYADMEV
jgi:uncharacterized protein YukE